MISSYWTSRRSVTEPVSALLSTWASAEAGHGSRLFISDWLRRPFQVIVAAKRGGGRCFAPGEPDGSFSPPIEPDRRGVGL